MALGDYINPELMGLAGGRNPAAGALVGETAGTSGYDLTPPAYMGGGGLGNNLSNILMALGSTAMMVDPTGQSRNAGVAMMPFVSRQIQATRSAQEFGALTDLVSKAEQEAGGDPRRMLDILRSAPVKFQDPTVQKQMFDVAKGLRDKVLARQDEETGNAALSSLRAGLSNDRMLDQLTFIAKLKEGGASDAYISNLMKQLGTGAFKEFGFSTVGPNIIRTNPREGTATPVYAGISTKETPGGLVAVQEPVPAMGIPGSVTPYPGAQFSLGADTRLMTQPGGGQAPVETVGVAPKPADMGHEASQVAAALGINTDPRAQSVFEKQLIGRATLALGLMQPDQKAEALKRPDLLWRVMGAPQPEGLPPQTGGTELTIGADTRKVNQAQQTATASTLGGLRAKDQNLGALERISQAEASGAAGGTIQGKVANLPALMMVESGEAQAKTEGANRVVPNKDLVNYYNPQTNKFAYQDPQVNSGKAGVRELGAAGYIHADDLGGKEKFVAKQAQINVAKSHLDNLSSTIMNLYRKGAIGDWDETSPTSSEAKAQANRVWRTLVQQGDPDIQALETFRAVGLNIVAPFMPPGTRGGLGLLREIEGGLPKSNSVGTLQSWQSAINSTQLGLKSAALHLVPVSEQGITGSNFQEKLTPPPLPGPSIKDKNYGILPLPR